MDWSDSWRGAFRIELRAQAIGLACRGWSVMPGTYPAGSQWVGGNGVHQDGPSPVHADWADRLEVKAEDVAEWWNGGPYSLLVATGTTLDAIEVGADLGRRTAAVLRASGLPAPIAATPSGKWLFLTTPGQQRLHTDLAEHDGVVLHGPGSWIPMPPSAFLHGIVHWRVSPEVCGWDLPKPITVQRAMVRALSESTTELVPADQSLVSADRAFA
ncbi:MAG TPA: bifunctional DNA primase/polymerase [Pseudonocardiaceae bacterium]|jgi:hypothetical protein|nr:bifunctional DNA primase/polymerase [Pseudonocardiaceae bacterium]